jgi:hypothetical protein
MSETPRPSQSEPFPLQSFSLPRISGCDAGPINTIAVDSDRSIFYTDEVNNSVVHLNHQGSLLWHKSDGGSAPGQFRYPKGLSLGYISKSGKTIKCLAVCDTWNRRIQFLDPDGDIADIWKGAGNAPFVEVTDIKYIPEDGDSGGFWLVLDKGNHRLLALNPTGKPIFFWGCSLPPGLERTWAFPPLFFLNDPFNPDPALNFPTHDYLYFPERIIGHDISSFFIWEPLARTLKAASLPYLLPIQLAAENGTEWFDADPAGLLGWRRSTQKIVRYNFRGELTHEMDIDGIPVAASSTAYEYWVQRGDRLECRHYRCDVTDTSIAPDSNTHSLMRKTAFADLLQLEIPRLSQAIQECLHQAKEELAVADRILQSASASADFEKLNKAMASYPPVKAQRPKKLHLLGNALHAWSIGILKYHLCGAVPEIPSGLKNDIWGLSQSSRDQIRSRLKEIDECETSLSEILHKKQDAMPDAPASALDNAVRHALIILNYLQIWIHSWSGISLKPVAIKQEHQNITLGYIEGLNDIPLIRDKTNRDWSLSKTDSLVIKGWAVDSFAKNVASEIHINIDGICFYASYGLTRQDLIVMNQQYSKAGFICEIPMKYISKGEHTLSVLVGAHDRHCFYKLNDAVLLRIT